MSLGCSPGNNATLAAAVITGYPGSLAARMFGSSGTQGTLVGIDDGSTTNRIAIDINIGTNARAYVSSAAGTGIAVSSAVPAAGAHSLVGVFVSATSRLCYLDGGNVGTNATNRTPAGLNATRVGRVAAATNELTGDVGEVAAWSVALTAADVAAWHAGAPAFLIRPEGLVFYGPLVRGLIDIVGGNTLTLSGSPTTAAHSRIIRPPRRQIRCIATAVVPAARRDSRHFWPAGKVWQTSHGSRPNFG